MAGMTIPTIPRLPAGYVVTETDLSNLSAAASFAINKPAAFIYDGTGGQAITTSFAAVTFTAAQFQTDSLMFQGGSPKRCYVQTPGWYKVCYSVNVGTVGGVFNTAVRSTTGANNPQGSGVNSNYY